MAEDKNTDFLNAVLSRIGKSGYKTKEAAGEKKYGMQSGATLQKSVGDLLGILEQIGDKPRISEADARKQKGFLSDEEKANLALYDKYDKAREMLAKRVARSEYVSSSKSPERKETMMAQTYDMSPSDSDFMEAVRKAVDTGAREKRESSYQKDQVPAAAPAPEPTTSLMDRAEKGPYPATPNQQPILDRAEKGPYPANPDQGSVMDRAQKAEMIPMMEEESEVISSAGERRTEPAQEERPAPTPSETVRAPMERQMTAPVEAPPEAEPLVSEDRMMSLFKTSTGTRFNPKSKADAGRMAQLRSFVESNPDVLNKSDVGASLAFYRTLK